MIKEKNIWIVEHDGDEFEYRSYEDAVKAELNADFERLRKDNFDEQLRKVEDISRDYQQDQENLKNMVDQLRDSIYTIAGK